MIPSLDFKRIKKLEQDRLEVSSLPISSSLSSVGWYIAYSFCCCYTTSFTLNYAGKERTAMTKDVTFKGGKMTKDVTFKGGKMTKDVTFKGGKMTKRAIFKGGKMTTSAIFQERKKSATN